MSRIRRAFENRFQELLGELGARDRDRGVSWLLARAAAASVGNDHSRALAEENIQLVRKVHRFWARTGRRARPIEIRVICDAGLGGLARWLRAVGCEAFWTRDISDESLVEEAVRLQAVVVTTDSFLSERRPIRLGVVRAIWVPPSLTRFEQLRLVLAELPWEPTEARCMNCGGELGLVDKEAVKHLIPPRTLAWQTEYFQCRRCRQLFWRGTHWERISRRLQATETGQLTGR